MPEVEATQLRFASSGTALRHNLACEEKNKSMPKIRKKQVAIYKDNILQNN